MNELDMENVCLFSYSCPVRGLFCPNAMRLCLEKYYGS